MAAKEKAAAEKPAGGGGKKLLIPVVGGVVLAAGIGAGLAWYLSGKAETPEAGAEVPAESAKAPAEAGPATYIALEPAFVVNLADPGGDRYLQVEVQLMTRKAGLEEKLGLHMPVIRNRLLLLFSQQTVDGVRTREAKEALQEQALKEVQAVLTEATGEAGVDALYFTSFVTQ
ncbi:flagellar basal body-associated FliL family protein [Pseudomarimonas salicorniae]|uniref:Flagellar protein FliL n=1 Tax=Pseudomarimonas salicorniae TaxID=2933270 RepID=A0ABT0GKR4_9GAMM|nr:flagellar basal body-associated FliL family protein [Lysobacter sp. CAU 1642]MCK7595145.1 flagellar basal body-associated FliL family protein [Lysobacter sp. CAU 1642]